MRWSDVFFFSIQAVLVKSREQVADELSRLQRDNESLQGKHRLHIELQQQEDFQMPNTVQVCGIQITYSESVLTSEAGMGIELKNFLTTNRNCASSVTVTYQKKASTFWSDS